MTSSRSSPGFAVVCAALFLAAPLLSQGRELHQVGAFGFAA
ncbi:hypothetical protein HaLaN_19546, partial [Haematococcus lacustris]